MKTMTTNTFSLLDQAELMQLALNASTANDSGTAIAYLKEAVSRTDAGAGAHYLLGAEYAQIRMYDRAADEMEAALAIDPTLSVARLQLGLLWLSGGAADKAAIVLGPLEELAADEPLRLFGQGLRHLIADQMVEARACLLDGIARNSVNPPLNGDMQRIVEQIDLLSAAAAQAPQAAQDAEAASSEEADSRHVLLSAYTNTVQ